MEYKWIAMVSVQMFVAFVSCFVMLVLGGVI